MNQTKSIDERVTVKLNVDKHIDLMTAESLDLYAFSYNLTEVSANKLVIDVQFENPEVIGTSDEPDILHVYVNFDDIDPTFHG